MRFMFGTKVADHVSGIEGYVIAYAQHITGEDQYLIQPPANNDIGVMPDALWFDEGRIEEIAVPVEYDRSFPYG